MTATTSSPVPVIAVAQPVFADAERLALAGFLAGYTGLIGEAYGLEQIGIFRGAITPAGSCQIAMAGGKLHRCRRIY
jgi:hypothetical protein